MVGLVGHGGSRRGLIVADRGYLDPARDLQGTAADREEIAEPTETLEMDADLSLVFEAAISGASSTGTVSGEIVCLAGPGSGDDACDDDDYPQTFPIASWMASGVPLP